MAFDIERLKLLAKAMVDAMRRQIALNSACALKSADIAKKLTPEELRELRTAIDTSQAAREALADYGPHPGAAETTTTVARPKT